MIPFIIPNAAPHVTPTAKLKIQFQILTHLKLLFRLNVMKFMHFCKWHSRMQKNLKMKKIVRKLFSRLLDHERELNDGLQPILINQSVLGEVINSTDEFDELHRR